MYNMHLYIYVPAMAEKKNLLNAIVYTPMESFRTINKKRGDILVYMMSVIIITKKGDFRKWIVQKGYDLIIE